MSTDNDGGIPGAPIRPRLVHRATLMRADGAASAMCFARPKPIDLSKATWTNRDEAVTCPKCRVLMAAKGRP